jgi:predicted metal-dependent peptidase
MITTEERLKKAHITLMKHPETALYSGIILMGKNEIVDDCPTAKTDGFNKYYGRKFVEGLSDEELRALVLHENLHVALNHVSRFKQEFRKNAHHMNVCADYVVNDVITHLEDTSLCKLPEGGLYDDKYHNWSVNEILKDLEEQEKNKDKNCSDITTKNLQPLDEHDFEGNSQTMTPKEQQEMTQKIENALKEGSILAGKLGKKVPRAIDELFEPKLDWREMMREFISSTCKGNDEYTWRKFNKRMLPNDLYLPSMENESVGELVIACDTSGSIGQDELTIFATELQSIVDTVTPDLIRILWWDYEVCSEQIFRPDQYQELHKLLKVEGGGGTRLSCVSEYITKEQIKAEAIIVFTDGWVEQDIQWNMSTPTLYIVNGNKHFEGSAGSIIVQYD